jgi:hypothetical protein
MNPKRPFKWVMYSGSSGYAVPSFMSQDGTAKESAILTALMKGAERCPQAVGPLIYFSFLSQPF